MCRTYDFVQGTTYGYRLGVETCEDCESNGNGDGGETCGPQYTCYQGFVKLQYDEPGDNCEFQYRRRYNTVERAMFALHKDYPINSTHTFILLNYDDELHGKKQICQELKHGKSVWTGGVVLLCLAVVVLLGWIIYGFFFYKDVITLLSTLQYVPVNYNTSPSITSTSDPNIYTNPNVASHHSTNHSPYAPVGAGMEMVRTSPDLQCPPVVHTNNNTLTNSYKTSPNTASVTPYPSTLNYTSTTNNTPYNPHYTSNTITATPTAPLYPNATPTTPNIPHNISAKPSNPSYYPAYTPVTAYATVHASSAHEEYDMY